MREKTAAHLVQDDGQRRCSSWAWSRRLWRDEFLGMDAWDEGMDHACKERINAALSELAVQLMEATDLARRATSAASWNVHRTVHLARRMEAANKGIDGVRRGSTRPKHASGAWSAASRRSSRCRHPPCPSCQSESRWAARIKLRWRPEGPDGGALNLSVEIGRAHV